jgi:hypothetical protein
MNSYNFNQILAAFFTNEFLLSILPKRNNAKKEEYLKEYRENIDNYCNSINSFMRQQNPAYEIILDKLVTYFKNYINCNKDSIINFACSEFCSKNYLYNFSKIEKAGLFRKFITECVKNFTALALVNTTTYVDYILGIKNKPEETKFIKKKMVTNFELAITEIKNQIFTEFSCLEQGKDPNTISIISTENKMIEELRKQNEELRFEYLQVKNENHNLKQKILLLENIEKPEPNDSAESEDSSN